VQNTRPQPKPHQAFTARKRVKPRGNIRSKERWQIELFFKALKQNLKVKSFVGTSENALRIQIWTALIAMLLLKWLHHLSKASWSLSNLASMLRLNLFTYRDLRDWLDDPFNTPPLTPLPQQLELPLPGFGQAT